MTAKEKNGAPSEKETREATLRKIIFQSPTTAFMVGVFEDVEENETFTACGEMLSPNTGDVFMLEGEWKVHSKYGAQFVFDSYQTSYPATKDGIIAYLASGMVKGIGKTLAKRIVGVFGDETIEILNNDIHRLKEIPGIGPKNFIRIKNSWDEQRGVQNVMLFLKSHGVSTAYAVKIYKAYGTSAVLRLQDNPYQLIDDIEGIGFTVADRIAQSLGIASDAPERIMAGFEYLLREAAWSRGHVYLPRQKLLADVSALLEVPVESVEAVFDTAVAAAKLRVEDDRVYLPVLWFSEARIAFDVKRLQDTRRDEVNQVELFEQIKRVQEKNTIEFAPYQVDAIQRVFSQPVVIITGGPGTGKSTALVGILAIADHLGLKTALCAPTGRAAKRMAELTRCEAKTIHRLLEFDPFTGGFKRDESQPLEVDLLVVDEVSMVDTLLMASLLRAVADAARVVLIGDVDQLPSVGPGNVLRDMIASGALPVVRLTTIFRQAQQSAIVMNSHNVLHGEPLKFRKDTFFVDAHSPEELTALVREIVVERLPREMGFDPVNDIQVLTPMRHTAAGVLNLNRVLQEALNPEGRVFFRGAERVFRVGDKVMQIRNNYEKDIYNGDIGVVVSADEEEAECVIRYDGRDVLYSFSDLDEVVLSYAITIHKSQGSEYPCVVIPMTLQHRIMLQRNLVYTAMTRARRLLVFVGNRAALTTAIRNTRIARRYTSLSQQLQTSGSWERTGIAELARRLDESGIP